MLFLMMWTCLSAHAQIIGDYAQTSSSAFVGSPTKIGLIVCNRNDNASFNSDDMDDYVHRLLNPAFERMRNNDNIFVLNTFDTSKVHVFLHGVNKSNASRYEYRVLEYPNRVIKPWALISQFSDPKAFKFSEYPEMSYLGGYHAKLTHTIVVDVREKISNKILSTALVHWQPIRPTVANIYTGENLDAFFQHLQHPNAPQKIPKTNPDKGLVVTSGNANLIFFLKASISRRNQVQYQIIRDGKVVVAWKQNDYDNSFIWLKENHPGTYKLNIRYTVQPQHVATYQFKIEPVWYQSDLFKIAIGILIAAASGALLFLILLLRQKKLTGEEIAKKTKLQLELKSIHAQLNPHFVFNALSSIQGLINKKDIKGANNYLVEFAKLMRESLTSGNKEEIPLKKEIDVMNTYIKLEQLRFGFEYEIVVDDDINTYEINIPSLLLQPLVENAIKHGVTARAGSGKIEIHFKKIDDILLIILKDNGNGFDKSKATTGYGLKLTGERLQLLNALKPEQKVALQIESQQQGTEITLTFNNWFL